MLKAKVGSPVCLPGLILTSSSCRVFRWRSFRRESAPETPVHVRRKTASPRKSTLMTAAGFCIELGGLLARAREGIPFASSDERASALVAVQTLYAVVAEMEVKNG